MLTQDEYNEIEQLMVDKEMMIDILRIKLSNMTADRNSYLELLDEHKQWIETMETMLINTDFTSNTNAGSSKVTRFFAPITRKLRAFFCAK
jgi:hypothetical protein